ncbi:lipase family alpha/beta hydrolase [Gordonia hankookensis]|uniref:Alpha/beta hydrolase n=1 Tax=Gordonia hankookensis TaxID=589403 RepID=A0ABR7WL74_9ACTN|nr:alpha/beta hydrolase [Gordonia hankookensis]MBD1322544.1 alpha/beta hydrolase [Gordonia hankookensis]
MLETDIGNHEEIGQRYISHTHISPEEIVDMADVVWGDLGVPEALWRRVGREATAPIGTATQPPGQWLPHQFSNSANIGSLRATEELFGQMCAREGIGGQGPAIDFRTIQSTGGSGVSTSLILTGDDGQIAGGVAILSGRTFIAGVPDEVDDLQVFCAPSSSREEEDIDAAFRALQQDGDEFEDPEIHIWARYYLGRNSQTIDFVVPNGAKFRPLKTIARSAGVLVGAAVMILSRKNASPTDPFRKIRSVRASVVHRHVDEECPELAAGSSYGGKMAVAVHGTMATGHDLAHHLQVILPHDYRVVRYEHDTFSPIGANSEELRELLAAVDPSDLILVGHSRGGLVAEQCARLLDRTPKVVTLGAPFFGTPMVGAADLAVLGMRSLSGGIRALSGSVIVDALAMFVGFTIKNTPQGIAAMAETSDWVGQSRANRSPAVTLAYGGRAPRDPLSESSGVCAFLSGIGSRVFSDAHDLVVPSESSLGNCKNGFEVVCDHFSYLNNVDVTSGIQSIAAN